MAAITYELFFGTANAGGAPVFARFSRSDTHAALVAPAISEIGNGLYGFPWDWSTSSATSIEYVATLSGVELYDVISTAPLPGSTSIVAQTLNLNGYSTAKTILNRVAVQVGLAERADPFDAVDANFVRLVEFLTTVGDDLSREHDWAHLIKEFTFVTNGVTQSYALPADFHDLVDQTEWNRTTRFPLIGPMSGQETQFLKAQLSNVLINVAFRLQGNLLVLPIVPPSGSTCAAEYVSSYWIKSATGSEPDNDHPVASGDICLFDPLLLVRGVKLQYLMHTGLDTTLAQAEYEKTLDHAIGKNTGAPKLSFDGGSRVADRFVNGDNVPQTGFGA